jgi:hypothetical protein
MRWALVMAMLTLSVAARAFPGTDREIFRNEKVVVVETAFEAGREIVLDFPGCVAVVLEGGTIATGPKESRMQTGAVKRGDVAFWPAGRLGFLNRGQGPVRYIRTCFLGPGRPGDPPWGAAGLSPNYRLLFENPSARVYEIRIAAGTKEPLHTHKDRVVVCLSGAEMQHVMPDGSVETSSLKADEAVWRKGGTHIGINLGKTDLWVIAIEPK